MAACLLTRMRWRTFVEMLTLVASAFRDGVVWAWAAVEPLLSTLKIVEAGLMLAVVC